MNHSEKWSVYVVRCRDGTFYTGSTNNVRKRISLHNSGKGAKYTRSRLPVVVIHVESLVDKSTALKRESEIKKMTRTQKITLIRAVEV